MNITKEDYQKNIKPCFDKIYKVRESFDSNDEIFLTDSISKIVEYEFEFDKLLDELNKLTPLQKDLLEKFELSEDIQDLTKFLESKRD